MQTSNIEHFLKENARIKRQVQASLSPACSPGRPATKRPLGNSKESFDEVCIDAMDCLEDPDRKKLSWTLPSAFAPTNTSIAKFLAGIHEYHSTVGGITVQDKLEQLRKGDIICNNMKDTVGDQEVPV